MKLSEELQARGFIHQFSTETLAEILDGEKRTIYHGFDPSADSIHVGNFASWMLLRHLANAGHNIILLVGGGTGMIGDPKPDVERALTPPDVVAKRVEKLSVQAERLLVGQPITFVNNHDWLSSLHLIYFLRDIGKHFTVNELIKKDAIATRLKSDNGISYTEFAYPLLQAYDYLALHKKYGCTVQVGGSDQWGNIIAGVELIRKKEQKTVYAITTPLIIDKTTGKKFGKSEGNAVWLDAGKTSPFSFYQFWLNVADENVVDYLKIFTFLSLPEIERVEKTFRENPGSRSAQKVLAFEITKIVHGTERAAAVKNVSEIIFGTRMLAEMTSDEQVILLENAPLTTVVVGTTIVDVLVETKLASSKREARTFIESGAISVGGKKFLDSNEVLGDELFTGGLALLRRGKKQVHVLKI
jgi:tyrosyl-tRNA synthetase